MRYPDLDLDALRAFIAIADTGGFTAAGETLGRTQAAMSIKIKKLEEMLGRRIFERTSRSLKLTRDGEMLLGYARRLLELNDEARSEEHTSALQYLMRISYAVFCLNKKNKTQHKS